MDNAAVNIPKLNYICSYQPATLHNLLSQLTTHLNTIGAPYNSQKPGSWLYGHKSPMYIICLLTNNSHINLEITSIDHSALAKLPKELTDLVEKFNFQPAAVQSQP